MLKLKNINKSFGKQHSLNNVSFEIDHGEIVSVVGRSGCGKTTLLRIVCGLEIPDSGSIQLNDVIFNDHFTFLRPESRGCSLIFQDYALFPNMSMKENILFGKNSISNIDKINDLINLAGIEGIMNKYPHQCSGGEQQRVAIVRSMAVNPSIILMDEPLSSLDNHLKDNLRSMIYDIIKKYEMTAIIVTHDITDAIKVSDRIIVLDRGEIIQQGIPEKIYDEPNSKTVALLFGETNLIPKDLFSEGSNYFFDEDSQNYLSSIKPQQFEIYDEKIHSGKFIFNGQVDEINKIGPYYNIRIVCEKIVLKVCVKRANNVKIWDNISVVVD